MKRLNKITLILVAVMGMAISGCGSDMKKAPRIGMYVNGEIIRIDLYSFCKSKEFTKSQKIYDDCYDRLWKNFKFELISLKGRRDCSKLPVQYSNFIDNNITIKSSKDCPPKDRLNDKSYEFTIKTNYGTFRYDTSNKSSEFGFGYYRAIK